MESPRGLKEAHIHCANCRACLSLRQQSVQWAHGLVGHGDAPVLSEGCEPLISRQDVPLRYRVGCVASRSKLPRERFSPLTQKRHSPMTAAWYPPPTLAREEARGSLCRTTEVHGHALQCC